MSVPHTLYSISPSSALSGLVNIETNYVDLPASSLDRLVTHSSNRPRTMASGAVRQDGFTNAELFFSVTTADDLNTFMYAIFGGWTTPSVERAISMIDETGYYSPFLVYIGKPIFTTPIGGGLRTQVRFPLTRVRLQTTSKSANYTVTASDRLISVDSTSGSVTLTLPAAASVNPYTVFSAIKTVAANTLTIDPNGSETINGASTLALTARWARVDFYSTGTLWRTKGIQ